MAIVSDRVRDAVREQYGARSPQYVSALERLKIRGDMDSERVHAAVVIAARGSAGLFDDALEHAADDPRDLLDRAGLADADWRDAVLHTFGPA